MSEESTAASEGAGQSGGSTTAEPAGKTYTADELERIISGRVNKAVQRFADYDDLKSKAARADELEQAQQSDMDKLRTRTEREAQKRAEAEERAAKATERANTALMRAAVVASAATLNAADPHDVFTLLDKSTLTVDDAGNVEGVQQAVEGLLKAKPHLVKRAAGGFDGGRQGGPAPAQPGMNDLIRQAAGISPAQ